MHGKGEKKSEPYIQKGQSKGKSKKGGKASRMPLDLVDVDPIPTQDHLFVMASI